MAKMCIDYLTSVRLHQAQRAKLTKLLNWPVRWNLNIYCYNKTNHELLHLTTKVTETDILDTKVVLSVTVQDRRTL